MHCADKIEGMFEVQKYFCLMRYLFCIFFFLHFNTLMAATPCWREQPASFFQIKNNTFQTIYLTLYFSGNCANPSQNKRFIQGSTVRNLALYPGTTLADLLLNQGFGGFVSPNFGPPITPSFGTNSNQFCGITAFLYWIDTVSQNTVTQCVQAAISCQTSSTGNGTASLWSSPVNWTLPGVIPPDANKQCAEAPHSVSFSN